jgi:hypothetical protein
MARLSKVNHTQNIMTIAVVMFLAVIAGGVIMIANNTSTPKLTNKAAEVAPNISTKDKWDASWYTMQPVAPTPGVGVVPSPLPSGTPLATSVQPSMTGQAFILPPPQVDGRFFGARFVAQTPRYLNKGETLSCTIHFGEGARVYVADQLVYDHWITASGTITDTFNYTARSAGYYSMKVEMFKRGAGGYMNADFPCLLSFQ